MLKKASLFILIPSFSSLWGCNPVPTVNELCELHKETCEAFTPDSWCKAERKSILLNTHEVANSDKGKNKYNLLLSYENYKACMNKAAKIEHIKLKEKKAFRLQNEVHAQEKIEELSKATKGDDDPYLLYYHWSRYLDNEALKKFLSYEKNGQLATPELQFFLATHYVKRDIHKTIGLLFHALELYESGDEINIEIFKSLVSIFTDKKEYKKAYIWLKVLELYSIEDADISPETLKQYAQGYNLDAERLNKIADITLSKITDGEFVSPKY